MQTEKRNFDNDAAMWDENPTRLKLAADVAAAIARVNELSLDLRVLDFGCGTGLLTLQLQPRVGTITGADSSRGMLEVLSKKVAARQLPNVKTIFFDADNDEHLMGSYDLIVSGMALHHVKDIKPLLDKFYAALMPGGAVCLADLDSDDGQFHDDSTGVFHNGFDRAALGKLLAEAGFTDVSATTATEIVKPVKSGGTRSFSIMLISGCKPAE